MGGKQQEEEEDILWWSVKAVFPWGLKSYTKIFCEHAHLYFFHLSLIDHSVQLQFPIIIPTSTPVAVAHPIFHPLCFAFLKHIVLLHSLCEVLAECFSLVLRWHSAPPAFSQCLWWQTVWVEGRLWFMPRVPICAVWKVHVSIWWGLRLRCCGVSRQHAHATLTEEHRKV